jgi:hypothetical protein
MPVMNKKRLIGKKTRKGEKTVAILVIISRNFVPSEKRDILLFPFLLLTDIGI